MKRHTRLGILLLAVVLLMSIIPAAVAQDTLRKTVSIGLPLNTNVQDYETNAFTLYLEEQMNIDIEFVLFEDIAQKLPIMISSGSELPDMILQGLDNAAVINWVSQGVFVPLTEYWNNPEMTTHFDTRLAQLNASHLKDQILASVTMPDGEIYTLPAYDENLWNQAYYRVNINTAWLEKLNLKEPETLDDFTEVLRHFVNDDPNGNGIKDEIGLTGSASAWGANPIVWLMNSFIHFMPDYNYMNVENGKVTPAFTQDAFKRGLEYIHDLYVEGLLDPLSFTQDNTQMKAIVNAETPVVGVLSGASMSNIQGERANDYRILGPVAGPDGIRFAASKEGGASPKVFITTYAEDPELCFKIAEIQYDFEWRNRCRNGVEGENWTTDPEILSQWIGQFESIGFKPTYVLLNNVWGKPQNVNWGAECFPFLNTQNAVMTGVANIPRTPENEEKMDQFAVHYLGYKDCIPAELLGTLIHTEEENEIISAIQPVIRSYVDEMAMAFVTGSASFDQWDSFQRELTNMGLDEFVEVLQAAYDRKTN